MESLGITWGKIIIRENYIFLLSSHHLTIFLAIIQTQATLGSFKQAK
ncbi:hypothetical protein AM1_0358 [Acaryochloris marina MBIC11017]|uniref:Uncharacterized protein n=1 Tax=Acaryochloris marina (strain MBIC 11017) TaxID=329726 RepID=B0C9X7_ACAM1|nr:hypothetical protein AM1_0358 [Acaryochloris marina MBIC11017]